MICGFDEAQRAHDPQFFSVLVGCETVPRATGAGRCLASRGAAGGAGRRTSPQWWRRRIRRSA